MPALLPLLPAPASGAVLCPYPELVPLQRPRRPQRPRMALPATASAWLRLPTPGQPARARCGPRPGASPARRADSRDWPALLQELLQPIHPLWDYLHTTARAPYYGMTEPSEWATDIVFRSPDFLAQWYPRWIRHGITALSCRDALRYLGQQVPQQGYGGCCDEAKIDLRRGRRACACSSGTAATRSSCRTRRHRSPARCVGKRRSTTPAAIASGVPRRGTMRTQPSRGSNCVRGWPTWAAAPK